MLTGPVKPRLAENDLDKSFSGQLSDAATLQGWLVIPIFVTGLTGQQQG